MSTDESASTQDPVRDGDRRVGAGREGTGAVLDALALAAAPQPDNPRGRPSVKRLIHSLRDLPDSSCMERAIQQ